MLCWTWFVILQLHFSSLNIPRRLTKARERLLAAVKALYKYKDQPANHVFVFIIAHERRNQEPYAIPVQCVPCISLKDSQLRRLVNELILKRK